MRAVYWRRKGSTHVSKDYLQQKLTFGDVVIYELSDRDYYTGYPTRVLENEMEIIAMEEL